jgi:hypothetical protein
MEVEVMVRSLWFFERLGGVVELDGDFEFSPSCLVDFEGLTRRACFDGYSALVSQLLRITRS